VASIRKWGNGYQVRYRDPNGKQRAKTFDKRRDADTFMVTTEVDKRTDAWVAPEGGRILLRDWAKDWEATLVGVRSTTRERDLSMLRNHVLPRFGELPLAKIEHLDVIRWVADLSKHLAPSSVHKCHQILAKLLDAAVNARKIRINVARGVRLPQVIREEQRFLEPVQVSAIAHAIDQRYRHAVLLMAWCGLRIGEVGGLRWDDVDLRARCLTVERTVVEVAGGIDFHEPKTRSGRRRVPLPKIVVEALLAAPKDSIYVVPAPGGGPLRVRAWVSRIWNPAREAAGLDGLTPHHLRHTAVALWIAAGATPNEIAARAGHANVNVVLNVYGHLYESDRDALTDALDRMARTTVDAATPIAARRGRSTGR
jgi:integrase